MKRISTFIVCLLLFIPVSHWAQAFFTEQASNLGLGNSSYGNGSLGGGISFFDFDNDGWDDITLAQEEDRPVRFFKNNQGSFTEVTFNMVQNLGEVKSVTWVDYDNDGDNDFYISTRNEANQLFRNDGSMQFTDVTLSSGLGGIIAKAWGASWGDYDRDGWLDLFQTIRDSGSDYNLLYRNNGDGTFSDVTVASGLDLAGFLSFCAAFLDYDGDGWQDIYLANDRPQYPNLLYRNNGNGTFTEVAQATGTDLSIDAMSTTVGDANNDGFLDIYVSNTNEGNAFLQNDGDGTYTDIAAQNGTLMNSSAWGSVFLDAENDGDTDLYVSAEVYAPSPALPAAFYQNDGSGQYSIPANAGFAGDDGESYANAIGDIQNDGYPDIAVLNFQPDDMYLWRNDSPQNNNWLKVKLVGVTSNRMGIGSLIEIGVNGQSLYNYTLLGEGYLGQNSAWEFFGIGSATSIDYIRVKWLSGAEDLILDPPINTQITIEEGEAAVLGQSAFLEPALKIYPNPAHSMVHIQLSDNAGPGVIRVYTLTGALMHSMYCDKTASFNITNWSTGTYIVKFLTDTSLLTHKLIVD